MATAPTSQFDNVAEEYDLYHKTPLFQMIAEVFDKGLGNCNKFSVLDLAGGSGIFARKALDAGAERVDVVDTSEAMMEIGKDREARAGREGQIRWHRADASQPLWEQGIDVLSKGQYDVVIANWLVDHAHSVQALESMWQNIAASLKPGGKFLGIRMNGQGMFGGTLEDGKYGVKIDEFEDIPGGVRYRVSILSEPPCVFEATSMKDSYSMADEIPRKLAFTDFEALPIEDTEAFVGDPGLWKQQQEKPFFSVVTARNT